MMKYRRVLLGVGFLGLIIFVSYKSIPQLSRNAFANRLAQEITTIQQNRSLQPLEMKQVTKFSWDKMYVFGPYILPKHIEDTLGFEWKQAQKQQ